MRAIPLVLLCALSLPGRVGAAEPAAAIDFATCKDNQALDAFLRKASPLYAAMARIVEFHGGYTIEDRPGAKGGIWIPDARVIGLNPTVTGAHRASLIAFEMTNAYQARFAREIELAVEKGEITTKTEFAFRQELLEYDGLRLHREMLVEIEKHLGKIPPAFFFISNPQPDSVARYQLPMVTDYLRQNEACGHTASYFSWFDARKKQPAGPGK